MVQPFMNLLASFVVKPSVMLFMEFAVIWRVSPIGFAGVSGRNTEKSAHRTCCATPVVLSVVVRVAGAPLKMRVCRSGVRYALLEKMRPCQTFCCKSATLSRR